MVFLYLRQQDNGEESKIPPGATRDDEVVPGKRSFPTYVVPSQPCIPWPTMEVRLTLQKFAEIGSHGFPRVSRHGWKWSHWPAITTIIDMDIAHFSTRVLLMSAEILIKRKNHGSSWGGLRGDFGGFFVFWREYAKTKMGSEGRLWAAHSRRWGRRGDFGFRVFPVIPLLLHSSCFIHSIVALWYVQSNKWLCYHN